MQRCVFPTVDIFYFILCCPDTDFALLAFGSLTTYGVILGEWLSFFGSMVFRQDSISQKKSSNSINQFFMQTEASIYGLAISFGERLGIGIADLGFSFRNSWQIQG